MKSKLFVIGDVHGCYFTLLKLLTHWDKQSEQLLFVGDLIDRGNFSFETVKLVKDLVKNEDAVCLMGNHEYICVENVLYKKIGNWFNGMGAEVILQYTNHNADIKKDAKWFEDLPLIWQSEHFLISHAGIAEESPNPMDKESRDSVLWTRKPLKNITGKIQIHGHTPSFQNPTYTLSSNSWNIDSAAVYNHKLSGLKFELDGTLIEQISITTLAKDLPKIYDLSE